MSKELERNTKKELIDLAEVQRARIEVLENEVIRLGGEKIGLEDQLKAVKLELENEKRESARLGNCVDTISEAIETGVMVLFTDNVLAEPVASESAKEHNSPAARLLRYLFALTAQRGYK